jgi:competence protein ComEC
VGQVCTLPTVPGKLQTYPHTAATKKFVSTAVILLLTAALCHAQSAIPGPSVQPDWEKLPDGSAGRVADFRGVGDIAIPAYIRKPKGSGPFPVVVLLHGGKYSKEATFGLGRSSKSPVQDFINAGWAVYSIDYRPQNKIVIDPTEIDDCVEAVKAVRKFPFVDSKRVGLHGASHGANLSSRLIARVEVRGAVLCAPAALDLIEVNKAFGRGEKLVPILSKLVADMEKKHGAKAEEIEKDPKKYGYSSALTEVDQVKCPVLIINGKNDDNSPTSIIDIYVKKLHGAGKTADTYLPDNGPHGFYFGRPNIPEWTEATKRTVVFFEKQFKQESGKNAPAKTLDIYFIDVGRGVGNATLMVAPSGESMLLDAGPSYSALNVLEVINKAGLKKLDFLVTTHYHADHFGATAELAKQIPILHYVDHGPSIEFGKSDDWWKERRGPWFKAGMGERYDTLYKSYLKVRQEGRHLVVKAGDVMPIKETEVRVLCAAGKLLADPLAGAGDKNPACADVDKRSEDDAEDAQSIGVLVTRGAFRFVYLADLTWNKANDLFCPLNKVGSVDAYLITHHAQSFPKAMGDYYHGLSACPKSEVHGLRPRVAILSLGAMGHKQGDSAAIETVRKSPGLEDLWQTQFIEAGGEKNHNSPKMFIANIGGKNTEARYIKLSANADGSFTMLNSRDGFSKHYPVRKKDLGR